VRSVLKNIRTSPLSSALLSSKEIKSSLIPIDDFLESDQKWPLLAECIVRRWMFGESCPQEIRDCIGHSDVREISEGALRYLSSLEIDSTPEKLKKMDFKNFEDFFASCLRRRLRGILERHGWIAVIVHSNGEALTIPFRLENKGPEDSSCIDIQGTPIVEWSKSLKREGLLPNQTCKLLIEVGSFENYLSGDSLCLPVFLATKSQVIGLPVPHSFLASGAIKNGILESCYEEGPHFAGCKSNLAEMLGLSHFFLSSEKELSEIHFRLVPEADKDEAWNQVERKLREDGLLNLNFATAHAQLKSLEIEVKQRSIKLEDAITRLSEIKEFLENSETAADEEERELIGRCYKAMGAAYDHMLQPEKADEFFAKAEQDLRGKALVSLKAGRVVSHTDQGRLGIAEQLGLQLLSFSLNDLSAKQRLEATLRKNGGTAAQYMFYVGLLECENAKSKSKELLFEALQSSIKLKEKYSEAEKNYSDDINQCWCQLVNWYALFEPDVCEAKYLEATKEFESLNLDKENPSWHFLCRVRFLSAWRALELHEIEPEKIETWRIPKSSPDNEWLTALIYKYRSAIRRKLGQEKEAMQDIIYASNLLSYSISSFQNMLRAMVFIEKYEITNLEADKSEALKCLEFLEELGYLKDHPEIAPSAWKELLDGRLNEKDPRLLFPY